MKYKLHILYLYAKSLLQFFRMDKKVVLYWGGKFQASHIVRFTLTLCHQLWTISSIQWKNSQALNRPLTVLVENNIRKPLYLIICPLHLFMLIIWTLRMHHWPCLTRNQVGYDIYNYMYKHTFNRLRCFFIAPYILSGFNKCLKIRTVLRICIARKYVMITLWNCAKHSEWIVKDVYISHYKS